MNSETRQFAAKNDSASFVFPLPRSVEEHGFSHACLMLKGFALQRWWIRIRVMRRKQFAVGF
jgi:hypothetical protein